jgi:ribosomal-protein-alanine N-acetyltransferase
MNIKLEMLDLLNSKDVFNFEVENRKHFEKNLPPRADDYFVLEKFNNIIRTIIDEQLRGECFMYVIKDEFDNVIGRINFVFVQNSNLKTADLGYRIGEAYTGKGIATKAVEMFLRLGAEVHNLDKITAGTASDNIASQKVLERNGFTFIGKKEKHMEVNGVYNDSFIYVKLL